MIEKRDITLPNGITCQEYSDPSVLTAEPLVSVSMITYNHAPYIAQAIEGVVNQQTDFPIELLLHDDASTDGTADICMEYTRKYPNIIRFIAQEENQYSQGIRISATFQYPRARGKYLAICEGDDYWHDLAKLQKQVCFLEQHPNVGLVHSNARAWIVEHNRSVGKVHLDERNCDEMEAPELLRAILKREYRIITATVCARLELLQKAYENPKPKFLMGDLPLWIEMSQMCKFLYINEILATINRLPESACRSKSKSKMFHFQYSTMDVLVHYAEQYGLGISFVQSIEKMYVSMILRNACLYGLSDVAELVWSRAKHRRIIHFIWLSGTKSPFLGCVLKPLCWLHHLIDSFAKRSTINAFRKKHSKCKCKYAIAG